jgi:hypothetical protein
MLQDKIGLGKGFIKYANGVNSGGIIPLSSIRNIAFESSDSGLNKVAVFLGSSVLYLYLDGDDMNRLIAHYGDYVLKLS